MQLTILKIKATGVLVDLDNRHFARNLWSVNTLVLAQRNRDKDRLPAKLSTSQG